MHSKCQFKLSTTLSEPKIMTYQLKWASLRKILIQKKKKLKTASFSLCSKVALSAKRFPVIREIQEMWQNKCSRCLLRFFLEGGGRQKRWQKYRERDVAITNILNTEKVRETVDRLGSWDKVFGNTVSETVITCPTGGLWVAKQSVKQEAWGRQPLPFCLSHCPRRK